MGFYEELSRHYDEVFPVKREEMDFVRNLLSGRRRLIDIGCGTGNKTVHFAEPGREIVGVDNDAAMIATAARDHAAPGLAYQVADMAALDRVFPPGAFDAALCLGNTLVHLYRPGELENFLSRVSRILVPDGLFVLQIVNYDRILDNHVRNLPLIETADLIFRRYYEVDGEVLRFMSDLEIKDRSETYHNEVFLRPIRKEELLRRLAQGGFAPVDLYGDYAGDPYVHDSFHLIAACRKPGGSDHENHGETDL